MHYTTTSPHFSVILIVCIFGSGLRAIKIARAVLLCIFFYSFAVPFCLLPLSRYFFPVSPLVFFLA